MNSRLVVQIARRPFSSFFPVCNSAVIPGKSKEKPQEFQSEHLKQLSKFYSPELMESIKAAETAIDKGDWANRKPSTEFSPPYLHDFSKRDRFWDHLKVEQTDFSRPFQEMETSDVPDGARIQLQDTKIDARLESLRNLTGLSVGYLKRLKSKIITYRLVHQQTRKGKIFKHYSMTAVGDGNGMIGIGEGTSRLGMSVCRQQSLRNAMKNLQYIPRHEGRTIAGTIEHRYHGVKLFLRLAPSGFGLRVNHHIFEICELAGIKDLSAKVYKSRNGINIAKGVVEALSQQKSLEELALARGKKVVDLRKTYYSS